MDLLSLVSKTSLQVKDDNKMLEFLMTMVKRLVFNIITNILDIKHIVLKQKNDKITFQDMEKTYDIMSRIKHFCHMKMKLVEKDEKEGQSGGYYNPYPFPMLYFDQGCKQPGDSWNPQPSSTDFSRNQLPVIHPCPYSMDGGAFGMSAAQNLFSNITSYFRGDDDSLEKINKDSIKDVVSKLKLDVDIDDDKVFKSIAESVIVNIKALLMYYKDNYGSREPVNIKKLKEIVEIEPTFEHMSRIYQPSKK